MEAAPQTKAPAIQDIRHLGAFPAPEIEAEHPHVGRLPTAVNLHLRQGGQAGAEPVDQVGFIFMD